MNNEGLRIVSAVVENYKNIEHRIIEANGMSFAIIGKNGRGKSSLMQALMSPFNESVISDHVIKDGSESASVKMKIKGVMGGVEEEYLVSMSFTEKNKKGKIVLRNSMGEEIKGAKTILKQMMGNISFDVFEFIRRGRTPSGEPSKPGMREQVEIIKSLLPHEVRKRLYEIEQDRKISYDERTIVNRETERLKAAVQSAQYTQDEINIYSKPKTMDSIKDEMEMLNKLRVNRSKANAAIENAQSLIKSGEDSIIAFSAEIDRLNQRIKEVEAQRDTAIKSMNDHKAKITEVNAWLSKNPEPNTDIDTRVDEINKHNAKHEQVKLFLEAWQRAEDSKKKSDELTEKINTLDTEKVNVLSNANLPLKGVTFDEDRIYYEGRPFDEQSLPKSTIIGVGMKIAMAMNPSLKVVTIADGSLLDKESLDMIVRMANKYGYQLIIEIVTDDDNVAIEYYEDQLPATEPSNEEVKPTKKKGTRK